MRKIMFRWLVATLSVLMLAGCGENGGGENEPKVHLAETDTIVINSDRTITGFIAEDFDQTKYSVDDLNNQINAEISEYNGANGEGSVLLNSIEVDGSKIYIDMSYKTADDYSLFNEEIFFVGTVEEAVARGFRISEASFFGAETDDYITGKDLLKRAGEIIVISADSSNIRSESGLKYFESDDKLNGDNEVDISDAVEGALHCVVIK